MQPLSIEAAWVDDRGRAGYAFSAMSGRLWHYAISDGVPKRSLIVALVSRHDPEPDQSGRCARRRRGAQCDKAAADLCRAVLRQHLRRRFLPPARRTGGERAAAATFAAISASLSGRHLRDGAWWGAPGRAELAAVPLQSNRRGAVSDECVDICVIGAGAAGLTTAAIAAQLGARTVLIERAEMGGECLNTGCVPSKALLAAAKAAHAVRTARRFGMDCALPEVDFAAIRRHVRGVVDAIAPHDSAERFEGLGVDVVRAEARFVGPREISAGNRTIRARRVVIATGSEPAIPPIPGIASVPYLTNETIFDIDRPPDHLVIIGAGAVGIELAQAHRRLGAAVTIVESARALPRDDPELAGMLLRNLQEEGVEIRERTDIKSVEPTRTGVALNVETDGRPAVSKDRIC